MNKSNTEYGFVTISSSTAVSLETMIAFSLQLSQMRLKPFWQFKNIYLYLHTIKFTDFLHVCKYVQNRTDYHCTLTKSWS